MIRPSIVFLLVVLSAALSVGWGYKGHMVVGFIADEHLTPEARQEMASFCRAPSTAYLANWADAIREDRPETAPWHYVNLPDGADGFVATRDVPDEGCVVDRIDHFRAHQRSARVRRDHRLDRELFGGGQILENRKAESQRGRAVAPGCGAGPGDRVADDLHGW